MRLILKIKLRLFRLLENLLLLKNKKYLHKSLITILLAFAILWSSIVSITYLGCLESVLLCPKAFLVIPLTNIIIPIPITELPLLISVIILASVNLSTLYAFDEIKKFHYILSGIVLFLVSFSLIFISSVVSFESALNQEINRLIQEGRLR